MVRDHVRSVTAVVTAVTATVVMTECSGGTPTDPENHTPVSTAEARQSVQDIVDQSASSLEGDWEVYSGPSVEQCSKSDGKDGAAYSYIKSLAKPTGEPEADIAVVEELWEGAGISTKPYKSGATTRSSVSAAQVARPRPSASWRTPVGTRSQRRPSALTGTPSRCRATGSD